MRRAAGATWVARAGDAYRQEIDGHLMRLDRMLAELDHVRRAVLQHTGAADAADGTPRCAP
ncbi:hypothetical protein [Actinotalea sp. Marseille-Q4924]|uniref:hypothetical protein n=1 Tax=Actinotalea sp. Marseille-Q4924 TaxID=2866571 RepID=UPI001CE42A69|nr:hypothetical protein [Actinotalea sp. Marseille-Q4924]